MGIKKSTVDTKSAQNRAAAMLSSNGEGVGVVHITDAISNTI